MELIFLYIKKEKSIEKGSFLFNKNYNIVYKDEVLSISEPQEKNIYSYHKSVNNITAIIGMNGTGKTTVLEIISEIYREQFNSEITKNIMFIYKHDEELFWVEGSKFNDNIKIDKSNSINIKERKEYEVDRITYYDNLNQKINSVTFNMKRNHIFNSLFKENKNNFNEENLGFDEKTKELIFNLNYEDWKTKKNENKIKSEKIIRFMEQLTKSKYEKFFPEKLYFKFQDETNTSMKIYLLQQKEKEIKRLECLLDEYEGFNDKDTIIDLKNHIKLFEGEAIDKNLFNGKNINTDEERRDRSIEDYRIASRPFNAKKYFSKVFFSEIIDKDEEGYFIPRGNIEKNIYEIASIVNSVSEDVFFRFPYKLSSGEEIVYKLYESLKTIEENHLYPEEDCRASSDLAIILDEPETSLHAEWQRTFLSDLFDLTGLIGLDVNIQIFIATHSPFIISDLYDRDIIYLKKDQSENIQIESETLGDTFGANIHDLLKTKFLKVSTIGEVARKRINEVFQTLNSTDKIDEKTRKEIKFTIENIGEKLIKNKLKSMYEQKMSKEQKISLYKQKIKEYEEKLKKEIDINGENL